MGAQGIDRVASIVDFLRIGPGRDDCRGLFGGSGFAFLSCASAREVICFVLAMGGIARGVARVCSFIFVSMGPYGSGVGGEGGVGRLFLVVGGLENCRLIAGEWIFDTSRLPISVIADGTSGMSGREK